MVRRLLDFSARGWARVILVTVVGTLGCVAVALYVDSFSFMTMPPAERLRPILINILLPMGLAAPLLLFFMTKLRELAIAHHELSIVASTDSLTAVLNRGAFTMLVDAYLNKVEAEEVNRNGALLVVDADNFKSINDRFGHDRGDDALRIIAQSIKSVLRGADIVGRIGGEEFGVFLPGSSPQQAEGVAERIRQTILEADFRPEGVPARLSVSVGGASFDRKVPFSELYRLADQRLYIAKQAGRNRIALVAVPEAA
jgi:diguanylate cyclase (GGDEF)-like protein